MAKRSCTQGWRDREKRQRIVKGHINEKLCRPGRHPLVSSLFPLPVLLVEVGAGSRPVVVREGGDGVQSPHRLTQ